MYRALRCVRRKPKWILRVLIWTTLPAACTNRGVFVCVGAFFGVSVHDCWLLSAALYKHLESYSSATTHLSYLAQTGVMNHPDTMNTLTLMYINNHKSFWHPVVLCDWKMLPSMIIVYIPNVEPILEFILPVGNRYIFNHFRDKNEAYGNNYVRCVCK